MSGAMRYIAEAVSEYSIELGQVRIVDLILSFGTFEHANDELRRLTGICHFFENSEVFGEFQHLIALPTHDLDTPKSREWGDFQTPPDLAKRVCRYLVEVGVSPYVIIEPTFGIGNFVLAALEAFPRAEHIYGVEIQEEYVWRLKIALLVKSLLGERISAKIELYHDNIFTHCFHENIVSAQNILIIGNPPWVTNAELGALEAHNLPEKRNIKTFSGIDAITGKSNFDICEFILLQMIERFSQRRGVLAMLCKNSVAKNIVKVLRQRQFRVSDIRALGIDAKLEFGVSAEASLLVMDLGASKPTQTCQVATLEQPEQVSKTFGWVGNKFVSNVVDYESHSDLEGRSALVWRQGVKHDCSKIMELDVKEDKLVNGLGDVVEVEEGYVYWLLKGSDLRSFEAAAPRKKVIITQSKPGDETSSLKVKAPALWEYLVKNTYYFEKRKSSIYRGKPRFSIFGIGDYSFKPYKVAISGLYKEPNFSLVLPRDGGPVMLDDTCYLLGFDTYIDALLTNSLLNSPPVMHFLRSIVFEDAKRPYTKEALMRIDMAKAASRLSLQKLQAFWTDIDYQPRGLVTELDLEKYRQSFLAEHVRQGDFQLRLAL